MTGFMSLSPNFRSFLVVFVAVVLMGSCSAARAGDTHPCRNIEAYLGQVYDKFNGAGEGEDLGAVAQTISENASLPTETRKVLVAGLFLLVQEYGQNNGKVRAKADFVRAGWAFCLSQFGPVVDRGSV